jgi:hypothetical protein
MKKISNLLLAIIAVAIVSFSSCTDEAKPKVVGLSSQNDSINYTLGHWQGDMFKQQQFAEDEDGKMLAAFIKALDEGYGTKKEPNEMYDLGLNVGRYIKSNTQKGFFGDSTLTANEKLIITGMINAIKDYQDVMTSTEADSVVQTIQMKISQKQMSQQAQPAQ